MTGSHHRRSPDEIVEAIYSVLPVQSSIPLTMIARQAMLDYKTAQKWVKLIKLIQKKEKLIEYDHKGRKTYSRTRAGRPTKKR